jgi:hypothetical protein
MLQQFRGFLHPCLRQNHRIIGRVAPVIGQSDRSNVRVDLALKHDILRTTRVNCR